MRLGGASVIRFSRLHGNTCADSHLPEPGGARSAARAADRFVLSCRARRGLRCRENAVLGKASAQPALIVDRVGDIGFALATQASSTLRRPRGRRGVPPALRPRRDCAARLSRPALHAPRRDAGSPGLLSSPPAPRSSASAPRRDSEGLHRDDPRDRPMRRTARAGAWVPHRCGDRRHARERAIDALEPVRSTPSNTGRDAGAWLHVAMPILTTMMTFRRDGRLLSEGLCRMPWQLYFERSSCTSSFPISFPRQ